MTSGTMKVIGSKGHEIIFIISDGKALSEGNYHDPHQEALMAIYKERSSRSPIEHNIEFLKTWILLFESQVPIKLPYKLGKNPPKRDERTLKFKKYIAGLKPPPLWADYESAVTNYPIYGNDSLGDCVAAAAGHMIQGWTQYAGKPFSPTLEDIINFYKFSGYNPSDPSSDNGWELLPALKNWRASGIAGHKIVAFVELETGNFEELKQSIALFGNAYLGFALPDFVVPFDGADWTTIPWSWRGSATPNPNNGHCVPAMGYNKKYWVNLVSWGARMGMDEAFYKNASDEAWAIVTLDWLQKDGRAPSGFDVGQLLHDLSVITGEGRVTIETHPHEGIDLEQRVKEAFKK